MHSIISPVYDKSFSAFLFDMDGTILNSIAAAERVWSKWAERQGLDVATFLPTMHGKRGIDTITQLGLPGIDPVVEAKYIEQAEIEDVAGVVPLPGAIAFLESLPAARWGIVTSSPIALAKARLAAAGMPIPGMLVTAEDVKIGKPAPDGYRLGAKRLGFEATDCLVFEDVPAGILAGEAAGAGVMVITATHAHPVETAHASIPDYRNVKAVTQEDGRIRIVRV